MRATNWFISTWKTVGAAGLLGMGMATVLLATGCAIGTGPTQEVIVDEPLGGSAVTDIKLAMGAGKLIVNPGASGLASGTIRYNVEAWKPKISRTDSSLTIEQGSTKGVPGVGSDIVNEWDLKLGTAPIRLTVTAGAYDGSYELGGLSLRDLSIKDGASKSRVTFSQPNPSQMDSLTYETGASSVTLTGLSDANFKKMDFKGGAGSFTLDFSGQLRSDASVSVQAGVGSVHIIVPAATAATVTVNGTLSSVNQEGSWVASDKTYSTPAAGGPQQDKLLSITVNMSLGSLTLSTD
jgi:hypothetical protein